MVLSTRLYAENRYKNTLFLGRVCESIAIQLLDLL